MAKNQLENIFFVMTLTLAWTPWALLNTSGTPWNPPHTPRTTPEIPSKPPKKLGTPTHPKSPPNPAHPQSHPENSESPRQAPGNPGLPQNFVETSGTPRKPRNPWKPPEPKVLTFWKFTSYCSLKPLWSGMGEVVPARTSPTLPPHPLPLCISCPN